MNKLLKLFFSIPKIIYFNFAYLPLSKALRFPIVLDYKTRIRVQGEIRLPNTIRCGMIRIGFHKVPVCNENDRTSIIISKGGILQFDGSAHLGNGSKIHVAENARLSLGENFAISASSAINCYYCIVFGKDIQFSWNCLVMDSDTHVIYAPDGRIMNEDKPITFGDKIWIGCNTTILKGTFLPSNCVVGANSVLSGKKYKENTIIAGNPAKIIKEIGEWKL